MTHFFKESYHAIDFRCAEGTPVLALACGVVTEVTQSAVVSGIHCLNLCEWNSIAIAVEGGLSVEYVHIKPGSAAVAVGDTVVAGDVLALSGKIGFAPEPHVHIEVHTIDDLRGPSVQVRLQPAAGGGGGGGGDGDGGAREAVDAPYLPVAGKWYGPGGETAEGTAPTPQCIPVPR
jgi:murein DD-endopeptidase MepM/ murein hydrolase activator NlpD